MAKYNCPVCKAPSTKETGCWKHSSKKPLKKSTLKKKPKTQEEKDENKKEIEKMYEVFLDIWGERPHKSEVSGKPIYGQLLNIYMHHIYPKHKFPELKYLKENIIILLGDEHQEVEYDMYKFEEVNKRRNLIKEKFLNQ